MIVFSDLIIRGRLSLFQFNLEIYTKYFTLPKKELSELSGVSVASIAKLGRNGNVTTEVLLKICTALNCEIMEIVED